MGLLSEVRHDNVPAVTVVTGPARSGVTTTIIEKLREKLHHALPTSIVWLVPSHRTAATLQDQLVDNGLGPTLGLWIGTFDQLASLVLASAGESFRLLPRALRWEALRMVTKDLAAAGKLPAFTAVAHTRGLIDRLYHWTSRCQRAGLSPEELRAGLGETLSPSMVDFLTVYKAYHQLTYEHGWLDIEQRLWQAVRILSSQKARPFREAKTLVVDGFTDFVPAEFVLLREFARQVDEVLVGLPLDRRREDLFAKPLRTLSQLKEYFPNAKELSVAEENTSRCLPPGLSHLQDHLFTIPGTAPKPASCDGVRFLVGAHIQHEVELVAEEIKRLLVDGDPCQPGTRVRPGDILVVVRSFTHYGDRIWETFRRFGIPVYIESGLPLRRVGIVRALLAAVELAVRDWPLRHLLTVVRHSYFRPACCPADKTSWLPGVVWAIRACGVASGRQAFQRRLEALQKQARGEGNDKQLSALGLARQIVDVLSQATADWSQPAPWSVWINRFCQLAACCGIAPGDAAGIASAAGRRPQPETTPLDQAEQFLLTQASAPADVDMRAWKLLWEGCGLIELLYQKLRFASRELTAEEAAETLRRIADAWEVALEPEETGRVRVLSPGTARAVCAPYVFMMGLSQGSFPAPGPEASLWSRAELAQLENLKIPVDALGSRLEEEMLLFYQVVTRAGRLLVLSYPAADQKGEPLLPASFVYEVEFAMGGHDSVPKQQPSDLSPIPKSAVPLARDQWRVLAVDQARQGKFRLLRCFCRDPHNRLAAEGIRRGLILRTERDRFGIFGRFDGMIGHGKTRRELQTVFAWEQSYSPTQLENYVACPFRFLMLEVLKLEPTEEPAAKTDHLRRGSRFHQALCEFHRRLSAKLGQPPTWKIVKDLPENELEQMWIESFESPPPENAPPAEHANYLIDKGLWAALRTEYSQQWKSYEEFCEKQFGVAFAPSYFEHWIGKPSRPGEVGKASETAVALPLGNGCQLRIHGRIDRIDVATVNDRRLLAIVDYKLGTSAPSAGANWKEDLRAGAGLQLAFYLYGASCELGTKQNCQPALAGYWLLRGDGFTSGKALVAARTDIGKGNVDSGGVSPTDEWQEICEEILPETSMKIIARMRQGEFPPKPASADQCRRCPLRTMCRVSECRSLNKTWDWQELPPSSSATEETSAAR